MHDKTRRPSVDETAANTGLAPAYLIHAAVLEISGRSNSLDQLLLGKLVRRRLSRLERVLAAHGGTLVRELPQGLLAAFDTAEAAVLVACEMQRRCAVIPQIMETQIGLKIGIHARLPGHAPAVAEAVAENLAMQRTEGSIAVSTAVATALPENLREKTSVIGATTGVPAHAIDWRTMPMRPAPVTRPKEKPAPAKPCLTLRLGEHDFRFDGGKSVITIGRDPTNDIVIRNPKASRQHCRIIHRLDHHVLVDLSMNGTFVQAGNAPEQAIRKNMVTLAGSGRIGFGHSCQSEGEPVFEFEID